MFGHFQTILNQLIYLGRTYDNYDHIDKILRSLSRKWRPQVTTLWALKNLDSMSLEELVDTLKVHENFSRMKDLRKKTSKSSSKALKAKNSSAEEFEEKYDEDEVAFISRKIHKMWKIKGESRWKNSSKRVFKEKKDKDKSSIICYECKKYGHFKV
ncbi:hypothetical protein glysoja_037990 [Glycine soja]|uniref:CCHC-type domain-containing protein n=1 Tax=Glycine soja TaxID=3848 RepID=A0A0B2SGY9_GLYSO|nr:hypothetical protein glysoja_037990 [Glycine soja]